MAEHLVVSSGLSCKLMVWIAFTVECVRRLEEITGRNVPFYEVDLLDTAALRVVFRQVTFLSCMFYYLFNWLFYMAA